MTSPHTEKYTSPLLFFLLVICLMSLGQVSADMYLPSLPSIAKLLSANVRQIQFTMALYMAGFCVSQFIYGPVSDSLGRKKPALIGIAIIALGSILCMTAYSINWLMLGRFIQGLGGGVGALSFAMVRDSYQGKELAKKMSYFSMFITIIMATAPILGGYIQALMGWRFIFIFIFAYSLVLFFLLAFFLPETFLKPQRQPLALKTTISSYALLLKDPRFLNYAICSFCAYGGIVAYLTASPVLLQTNLGLSAVVYGWLALTTAISYSLGGLVNGLLITRLNVKTNLFIGSFLMLSSAFCMLALSHVNVLSTILFPTLCFFFGTGFIYPNSFTGASNSFPQIAGCVSALFGGLQVFGAILASSVMALLPEHNALPLSLILLLTGFITLMATFSISNCSIINVSEKNICL